MSELNYAIDGGSVTIEDGTKAPEEYAPNRKVSVTLNWTPPDDSTGEEIGALFDHVTALASSKVAQLLGKAAPAALATATTATAADKPAARTRRTKEQIAADEAAKKAAETPASDEVSFDEDVTELPPGSSDGSSDASGEVSFDLDEEPAKEITDVDLNAAVQARNKEINNPGKIKALITEYRKDATKPFNLVNIPQAERQGFIDKLNALTA